MDIHTMIENLVSYSHRQFYEVIAFCFFIAEVTDTDTMRDLDEIGPATLDLSLATITDQKKLIRRTEIKCTVISGADREARAWRKQAWARAMNSLIDSALCKSRN